MRFALMLVLFVASVARAEITPMLFAIEKNGKTSYLLGTYHLGPSITEYPPFVLQILARQSKFMSESGLANEKEDEIPDPKVPPVSEKTRNSLRVRGFNEALMKAVTDKPHLGCLLYFATEPFLGPRPFRSLDGQFFDLAKAQGKLLEDLDDASVDDVVTKMFDCDVNELAETSTPDEMRQEYSAQLQKFRAGLVDGPDSDEVYQVRERNRAWLPKLVRAHETGVFAVMGYAHLPDLLQSLRSLGFHVWRVAN